MSNVAELFVQTLVDAGVQRVWGLPGDSLNAFTEAMRVDGRLEWMHMRHEESAAFAAGAEADVTGELAVVAGSCGPGNLHFINGLYDANRTRVPVLAIASHIPSAEIGGNYFQETHPESLFTECSVYCELVSDPSQLPWVLEIAMRSAIEQRGVAVVVIPGDVFFKDAPKRRPSAPIRRTSSQVVPCTNDLAEAAGLLNDAHKVTMLVGAGAAGARDEVLALADVLQAPIVHALRGKEHIEADNPFDVGLTGLLGFSSGYWAMEHCDVLLMLGTDFPYRQFYPSKAKVVQVDIRGEQLGRRTPIDLGLVGGVRETASALAPMIKGHRSPSFLKDALKHYQRARKGLDELANDDGRTPLHPQYLTRVIDELAAEDAIFTADVGSPVVWASRYLHLGGRRRLLGSFLHGSMANALPQALGAQGVDRDRQVIALAGDGGLGMLMGELLSIGQNNLPVKVVVFNNASLNFVELEMKAAGQVNHGTDLTNPDYAAVAEAVGIRGIGVRTGQELRDGVAEMLATDGPVLLDVHVGRQELSIPPAITAAQAKGFSLWALRTVMSGRGDQLLDLADTNVVRRMFS